MNTNPVTGIRYGVIALNSLDGDVANELWYGPGARDVSYEEAVRDLRLEAVDKWQAAEEEAEIAANETDYHMREEEFDAFVLKHIQNALDTTRDSEEGYVEACLEWAEIQIEEPTIEGTYEGVKYQISWLGGAPLLWVIEGPVGYASRLCSPCVPNAADLDSGFVDELPAGCHEDRDGFHCYVVPRDWLSEIERSPSI